MNRDREYWPRLSSSGPAQCAVADAERRQLMPGQTADSPVGGAGTTRERAPSSTRVVVLFRKLDIGGAERQIVEFAKGVSGSPANLTLVSFYDGGELLDIARGIDGVRCVSLGKRGRWEVVRFLVRAFRTIRRLRPDAIYGYQGVANELSLVIGRLIGAKVVWGIRASSVDLAHDPWLSRVAFRVGASLSRFADLIIANSESGARYFAANGYVPDRMVVIGNGINTQRFAPDPVAGAVLRQEWGVAPETPLVGIVARLDPMKDHQGFLRAVSLVHARRPDVRFVCVGDGGAVGYRAALERLSRELGIDDCVLWAGSDLRIPAVMNALDVLCSSSISEGFPNVVGEAMACGRPCAVTDAGDSARLVADCGIVVPPRSPAALSDALLTLLALTRECRQMMGARARHRVERHFSVGRLVSDTWSALESLM
jgi:glycosyltransferase involved in cell wall biosynthesis